MVLAPLLALFVAAAPLPALRDGDIVFQTSGSSQSAAIQRATQSPWSHMGIVFLRDGVPVVYEAVDPVRATPLARWVARGVGGRIVVKRLKDAGTVLTPDAVRALRRETERFLGRRYDLAFGWSDERIYCSELVWKAYDRALGRQIGRLQRLRDFDLEEPIVKGKLKERYGSKVPLDEPVISPGAMFASEELVTVASRP
jgi:Permuted papain-like amidase enzyme, YaeF/YiiX, C92 family